MRTCKHDDARHVMQPTGHPLTLKGSDVRYVALWAPTTRFWCTHMCTRVHITVVSVYQGTETYTHTHAHALAFTFTLTPAKNPFGSLSLPPRPPPHSFSPTTLTMHFSLLLYMYIQALAVPMPRQLVAEDVKRLQHLG